MSERIKYPRIETTKKMIMKLWKLGRKRRINKPKELYLIKYSGKEGNSRKMKMADLSEKTSVSLLKSFFKFHSHNLPDKNLFDDSSLTIGGGSLSAWDVKNSNLSRVILFAPMHHQSLLDSGFCLRLDAICVSSESVFATRKSITPANNTSERLRFCESCWNIILMDFTILFLHQRRVFVLLPSKFFVFSSKFLSHLLSICNL